MKIGKFLVLVLLYASNVFAQRASSFEAEVRKFVVHDEPVIALTNDEVAHKNPGRRACRVR